MQDNDPLMRALTNLINLNQPDLVLFVGEALVGNDAVDQLTKFNQRLADLATTPTPHLIDGVLLTKFDTIDDKVRCLSGQTNLMLFSVIVQFLRPLSSLSRAWPCLHYCKTDWTTSCVFLMVAAIITMCINAFQYRLNLDRGFIPIVLWHDDGGWDPLHGSH